MRDREFRQWLARREYQGTPLTAKGVNNRARKAPRIERALAELGFAERDLDTLHANGRWPALVDAVRRVAADWHANEAAARKMAPQAPDPTRQLTNLINVARQYGHFADGKDPNYDAGADAPETDEIDPAALAALKARFIAAYPNFEQEGGFGGDGAYFRDEDGYKRALVAKVAPLIADPAQDEAALGAALLDHVLDKDVNLVGDYRRRGHIEAVRARSGGALEAAVGALARSKAPPPEAAESFVSAAWDLIKQGSEQSMPYADIRVLATLFQALARPSEAIAVNHTRFYHLGLALWGKSIFGNNPLTAAEYEAVLDLSDSLFDAMEQWGWAPRDLWDAQGFVWVTCKEKPDMDGGRDADRVRDHALKTYIEPARARGDDRVSIRCGDVHSALGLSAAHANVCQALRGQKFQKMAGTGVPTYTGPDNSSTTTFTYELGGASLERTDGPAPTNLILYGPPGTGKTYATAAEAVKLCDGEAPDGRAALMARYRELETEKRIVFVTFHQNYDYETFVEGLRPETGASDAEGASAGFRLEPRPGIFREICALAEQARTRSAPSSGSISYDFSGRRFWKMGQGAIGSEDDVYDAAIANNYIALGWGGSIDWSPERFASFDAIKAEWLEQNPDDPTPSNWTQTWPFRSEMKVGDIVIVPYGNTAFRAIAEVTGEYRYEPSAEGYYAHRRDVRWLLTLDEPLPLDTIVEGNFTMRTLYALAKKRVNLPALGRLIAGDSDTPAETGSVATPEQFVLVIDEINRANISKVFGELITLIERDKRLGMGNALTLTLPYSKKRDFGVPANLHIIGTMNTADRSIALLDTALRRRFRFKELAPDETLLPQSSEGIPLRQVLRTINDRIEYLIDREHRVGHAFFIGCEDKDAVDAVMRDKVIPLLQEYFFEDWSRVAAVLGEPKGKGGGFLDCRKIKDPTGEGGEDRESWSVRKTFELDAYRRLVGKPVEDVPAEADELDGAEDEA
ncbi:AAA family ATPase [Sphingomonas suaedae]|nr:AAA family ATPase [Sphingomonas suaedae]